MWDLIESVPDHCLSFYFTMGKVKIEIYCYLIAEILTKVLQRKYVFIAISLQVF